jgi:hypothetical protein
VWRGAGAGSHAPGRSSAGAAAHEFDNSDEPDRCAGPYDADNPNHVNESCATAEFCQSDDPDNSHKRAGTGQFALTASGDFRHPPLPAGGLHPGFEADRKDLRPFVFR